MKTPKEWVKEKFKVDKEFYLHNQVDSDGFTLFDLITLLEEYTNQLGQKPKLSIEDRKHIFRLKCEEVLGVPVCFDQITIQFFDYWTEHSEGAKKMRFEKEKVFDIKKRLDRWKTNQKTFSNGKPTKQTRIENFEQGFREQFAGKDLSVDDGF